MAQTTKSTPPQKRIDARRDFTRRIWPWLIAAAMLVFYLATLNHWASLLNIDTVAVTSGWAWTPQLYNPLYYLATLPIRILPETAIPFALNLFSAVCAALTLGLLARSVGLLPQDRTQAQVAREKSDFFLLTTRSAWFPPLLAVLLCGLQMSFWEMATNGSVEMFNLLLFAFIIWSLLEYRLDGREGRLFLSAVIAGLMMAEGPAMVGYFPLFVLAIVWVRGLNIFNVRFLTRMVFCGAAGLLLFLLLPVLAIISAKSPWPFLQTVKYGLEPQIQVLKVCFQCVTNPGQDFDDLLMPLFISLMPVLVLSIRWKFGDSSRLGSVLESLTFNTIHAIFFGMCLWLVFDPPISPREKGLGLTLYYLIALSAGYYAGYFLLIFGRKHPRAPEFPPFSVKMFNATVLTAVWVLGTLAVAGLFYKNTSLIRADNNNSLRQYASLVAEGLPPKGAIVLSDYSQQMYLTQAALTDNGHANDYLLVDTPSLVYPRYHGYLHEKSPEKWPLLVSPQETNILSGIGLAHMLTLLSASNQLCYLHPNEGILFEEFYQESHGLITELKKLPDATLLPPAPDQNLIAENQKFWAAAQAGSLAPVEDRLEPPDRNAAESPIQRLLDRLHTAHEEDVTAIFIGTFCSRALNSWGVDLQRAGEITNAAGCFQTALQLNPDNIAAQVNLQVNGDLQAGHLPALDFSKTADIGKFTSLADVIKTDGPFDDPAFSYLYGSALAEENGLYRQAVAPLERVRQLAPSFITARVLLARIYAMNHLPDKALDAMRELLNRPADFSINDSDLAGLKILAAAAYFQKNDLSRGSSLLEAEISRDPTNDDFLASVLKVYIGHDMFTNALIVVDNRLRLSPDNPNWLYTKGYLENQMKEYSKAIEVFNKVLTIQKDNPHAIFQRGNAYMGNGNLEAARADYEKLQQLQTNSFQMAFLLGDIAWRQHNTNETIRNFQIYMANAPTNEPHMQTVTERLGELKQPAGGQ